MMPDISIYINGLAGIYLFIYDLVGLTFINSNVDVTWPAIYIIINDLAR
jgi:hypothetical protein